MIKKSSTQPKTSGWDYNTVNRNIILKKNISNFLEIITSSDFSEFSKLNSKCFFYDLFFADFE